MVVAGTDNFYLDMEFCNKFVEVANKIIVNVDVYLNTQLKADSESLSDKRHFEFLSSMLEPKLKFKHPKSTNLSGLNDTLARLYYIQFSVLFRKAKDNLELVKAHGFHDIRELVSNVIFPFHHELMNFKFEFMNFLGKYDERLVPPMTDNNSSAYILKWYNGFSKVKDGHKVYSKGSFENKTSIPKSKIEIMLNNLNIIMDKFEVDQMKRAVDSVKSFKPESYYTGQVLLAINKFKIDKYLSNLVNSFESLKNDYLKGDREPLLEKLDAHYLVAESISKFLKTIDILLPSVTDQKFHSRVKKMLTQYHNLFYQMKEKDAVVAALIEKFKRVYDENTSQGGFIDHDKFDTKQVQLGPLIEDIQLKTKTILATYRARQLLIGKDDVPTNKKAVGSFAFTTK